MFDEAQPGDANQSDADVAFFVRDNRNWSHNHVTSCVFCSYTCHAFFSTDLLLELYSVCIRNFNFEILLWYERLFKFPGMCDDNKLQL